MRQLLFLVESANASRKSQEFVSLILGIGLMLLLSQSKSFGQSIESCGHDQYVQTLANDPTYQLVKAQCDNLYQQVLQQQFLLPNQEYLIPCVVHVFYDEISLETNEPIHQENLSDCIVQQSIKTLNMFLKGLSPNGEIIGNDTHIQVALASIDPSGNPTTGIEHIAVGGSCYGFFTPSNCISIPTMASHQWDLGSYLNINVIDISYSPGGLGFATTFNGIFISDEQMDLCNSGQEIIASKTLVHEFGHYLNLRHTHNAEGLGSCHDPALCADNGTSFVTQK